MKEQESGIDEELIKFLASLPPLEESEECKPGHTNQQDSKDEDVIDAASNHDPENFGGDGIQGEEAQQLEGDNLLSDITRLDEQSDAPILKNECMLADSLELKNMPEAVDDSITEIKKTDSEIGISVPKAESQKVEIQTKNDYGKILGASNSEMHSQARSQSNREPKSQINKNLGAKTNISSTTQSNQAAIGKNISEAPVTESPEKAKPNPISAPQKIVKKSPFQ